VSDWDRIVAEHGPLVFGTAWRILGHAADAEDVTQDVFLQAYQTAQSQPVRCWPALLRRLAACRALDRLRTRKVAVPIHELALVCPGGGPEDIAIGKELSERLREALAQLPRQEAAAFCLRHFEDLSYQQIADALHVTPGAVGNALFKARARLERLLLGAAEETCHEAESPRPS
jgi:RNA polymerase sigma-70 factor (ECF subfamily)